MTNDPKKQIILNEILFWKQNKLLPEQYCDFLLTLYTEGEEVELQFNTSYKEEVTRKEKRKSMIYTMIPIFITLLLLATLFLPLTYGWVIALITGIIAIIFIIISYKVAKKYHLIAPILQVAAALLLLGISVKMSITYFEGNSILLYVLLFANCLLWTILGLTTRLIYFTVSGIIGVLILILYQLFFT